MWSTCCRELETTRTKNPLGDVSWDCSPNGEFRLCQHNSPHPLLSSPYPYPLNHQQPPSMSHEICSSSILTARFGLHQRDIVKSNSNCRSSKLPSHPTASRRGIRVFQLRAAKEVPCKRTDRHSPCRPRAFLALAVVTTRSRSPTPRSLGKKDVKQLARVGLVSTQTKPRAAIP